MKKAFYIFTITFSVFISLMFTSCHDSIFETIENEIALDKSGIRGSMGSIVEYGDAPNRYLYITPMNKGVIYRKSASANTKGGWQKLSAPKTPVAIASSGGTLYMLAVDWAEGSGDYEGYNVPTYFEYTSTNGTSWNFINKTYPYQENSGNLPSRYKNQHCTVTNSYGTYSIGTSNSTTSISTPAGSQDLKEGLIYAITATANTVIIGTTRGIFSFDIKPNGSLDGESTYVGNRNGNDTASTLTGDVPVVYVPSNYRTANEGSGPIYAYSCPMSSGGTTNEGLMAFFPSSGWNRDH